MSLASSRLQVLERGCQRRRRYEGEFVCEEVVYSCSKNPGEVAFGRADRRTRVVLTLPLKNLGQNGVLAFAVDEKADMPRSVDKRVGEGSSR